MAFEEQLASRVRAQFRNRSVSFEEKRMMGGLCILVDGKMCVGVDKDRLMVRIDPADYDAALQRPGCVPMDFTGRPMRGFVFVNSEGITDDKVLDSWIGLALEFNPRALSSRRKTGAAGNSPAAGKKRPTKKRAKR